jgi:hypothetical protein
MKNSRVVLTTACVAVSLSLTAVAMAGTTTTTAQKPATASSSKPHTTHQGKTMANTVTVTATVASIDPKTRAVTLKNDAGKEYSFIAEPYVKNLSQVKVGDLVTVTYTEAIAWSLKKDNAMTASSSESMSSAPAGQKPGMAAGSKTTVTVTITAIDPKAPSVTFTGPAGHTETVKVKDPKKLEGVNVGDKVDITYTEALAVKVQEAPKK